MPSVQEVLACDISNWYGNMKTLSIPTVIVPLSQEFVSYLTQDGIILPRSNHSYFDQDHLSDYDDDDDIRVVVDDSSEQNIPEFKQLEKTVKSCIANMDGQVFVKLNWSSPSDAKWINAGTIKCYSFLDIVLLLKSSDKIVFDLEHMLKECYDYDEKLNTSNHVMNLAIRKWIDIDISMEFRMFIYHNKLVGISQRDCSTYYEFLRSDKAFISELLQNFYDNKVKSKFHLESYTVDVYVKKSRKVILIDINVFGSPTSSLLFDWDEFTLNKYQDTNKVKNILRIIEHQSSVHPNTDGVSRGPIDVAFAPDFHKFIDICKQQQQEQLNDDIEDN